MTQETIEYNVHHIFESGANEVRVVDLITNILTQRRRSLPVEVINKYLKWRSENPDEDYRYDETHEFIAGLSRGELSEVFESLLKLSE